MNGANSKWQLTLNFCALVTAIIAVAGFVWSMYYSRQSLNYTAWTLTEIQKQRQLEEKRFSQDEQNRQHDEFHREINARAARGPFLSVARCCNQVPIVFADEEAEDHGEVVRLDPDGTSPLLAYPNYNRGFIGEITNFGAGAATDVNIIWHPESIEYSSGEKRELAIAETGDDSFNRPYAWPNYIASGDSATIKNIPRCISEDRARSITFISGVVEIKCRNVAGEHYAFWQNFTIQPVYVPDAEGNPARLSAHFLDIRDELTTRPYSVARPITP